MERGAKTLESIKKITGKWMKATVFTSAILFTVLWLILFPYLLYAAMFNSMFFVSDDSFLGSVIVFFAFFIPLSCPATVLCIWLSYYFERFALLLLSNLIPIITALVVVFVDVILYYLIIFSLNLQFELKLVLTAMLVHACKVCKLSSRPASCNFGFIGRGRITLSLVKNFFWHYYSPGVWYNNIADEYDYSEKTLKYKESI